MRYEVSTGSGSDRVTDAERVQFLGSLDPVVTAPGSDVMTFATSYTTDREFEEQKWLCSEKSSLILTGL
jgi:hypothetical protein